VYVAMRKKTTKEEREEIVRYCLEHGKDYKVQMSSTFLHNLVRSF